MKQQPPTWDIVFYQDHRGRNPVLEFINKLPVIEQARTYNALRLLREFGTSLGMPHARHIHGKLWELRPGGVRLFYFTYTGKSFVVLHGYHKKTDNAPERELAIAMRRMHELLEDE